MAKLNVVLHEPQIPQNTGNIARTCGATNASLHLIEPLGFSVEDKMLKRAGLDYWHLLDISYYKNLNDFFSQHQSNNMYYFTTKGSRNHTEINYKQEDTYLFFGREDAGLPMDLLNANKSNALRLPIREDARSLNLANTVAVGVFEVLRQWNYPNLK